MGSRQTEIVYGLHAVSALLTRHPGRVQRVYLQQGRADSRAAQLEKLVRAAGKTIERIDAGRLRARLGNVVHQGVVAEVLPLEPWREEELLAAIRTGDNPLLLALDGVQDPHNLGACLRTADACGVLALIVPRDRAAPLNATARKSASGAAETTPVVTVTNLARTLGLLKDAGLWIVGADAEAPQTGAEVDLTGPRVLVMGAEGRGLRNLTRRHCDWLARLPSRGAVESLNVSVAAGMLLYEALRQRDAAAATGKPGAS
ncbi:MAG TPA: 23S rRNA (guanosine(2251)-2'-O)-methyltransferase RlmB [Steroidobacteraceae bacterium]|nr:23S rRNA (guanosine(2251)-2'-O)-methyltransferase RlmB [Steroidobacteraceae bacterium]